MPQGFARLATDNAGPQDSLERRQGEYLLDTEGGWLNLILHVLVGEHNQGQLMLAIAFGMRKVLR